MVKANSINYYSPARWVVSKKSGEGTHTTISGALADATSGDTVFVMAGTYTEDLTLVPGVNITSLEESKTTTTPHVIVIGKSTLTLAGNVVITGIRLQTNLEFFLVVSGTAASTVLLMDCFLDCANNTGISYTSSNVSSAVLLRNCEGNVATVGTTLFVSTSAGPLDGRGIEISNSGASVTPSTSSVGSLFFLRAFFTIPLSVTGTALISLSRSSISNSATDTTCITGSGTGSSANTPKINLDRTSLDSKNAGSGAISIAAGNHVRVTGFSEVRTSGANAITGAGTLLYDPMLLTSTFSTSVTTETPLAIGPEVLISSNLLTTGNNVSDIGSATNIWKTVHAGNVTFNAGSDFLDDYEEGTFTPTLIGSTGAIGAQTYGSQVGTYIKIGNKVTLWGSITLTNKGSWTGIAVLAGFPFTASAGFTAGSNFIDGRDLAVSGAGHYLVTNNSTLASSTSVALQTGGAGAAAADQDFIDITNTTSILYTFTYQE